MTCLHCEGWTCARCASPHDVAAAGGGEQSLTAAELEAVALRALLRAVRHAGPRAYVSTSEGETLAAESALYWATLARIQAYLDARAAGRLPSPPGGVIR